MTQYRDTNKLEKIKTMKLYSLCCEYKKKHETWVSDFCDQVKDIELTRFSHYNVWQLVPVILTDKQTAVYEDKETTILNLVYY